MKHYYFSARIALVIMTLLITTIGFAQTFRVKGVVTSTQKNEKLPLVNVIVKGTSIGTVTDLDGLFSIDAPEQNSILVFSFIGYDTKEVPVNGQSVVNVALTESSTALSDVVVIGYGTIKKKDLTGSVSVVDVKEMNQIASNDITKTLQGKVAGISVQGSGEPGAAPKVKIRGVGTFGDNTPLYIVDGVQTPINDLPVSDIETVQVLKDGSACAIYGSRAANGVVIMTTKRGQAGKTKINYNGYYGWQKITNRIDMCNREDYQMLVNEATNNANDPRYTILPANDPTDTENFVNNVDTDWQKEMFKTGKIQDHSINISGGNEISTFNFSLGYFYQTPTIQGNGPSYERYAVGLNSDHKKGKFKFGESMHYTIANQGFMAFGQSNATIIVQTVTALPTIPVFDENSMNGFGTTLKDIHSSYTTNPVAINNLVESSTKRYRFTGNAYGEYELIPDLKYRLSLSFERTDWKDFSFMPIYNVSWAYPNTIARMNDWRGYGQTATLEQTLTYDKTFGKHKIIALLGNTVLDGSMYRIYGHAEGFSEPYFKELSRGTSGISATGDEFHNRLLSYFGRIIYDFGDKYMLTATVRRDGSSRFGKDYRWGVFPSVAVGWKLQNEEFLKSIPAINELKIRASYGELGNQEIGDYLYQAYINPYVHAVFNSKLAVGATQIDFATPDIHWESKKSTNIGFDLGLFENKITLTAEYYNNKSENLLVRVPIPECTGVYNWNSPLVNGASMTNLGLEFNLGYRDSKGDISYSFNANLATVKNEVLSLGYGNKPINGQVSRTEVGSEVGEIYGYEIEGIFQAQADIDALNQLSSTGYYQAKETSPGDYKFKDINGRDATTGKLTGKPDGKIDADDRTYLGSAIPNLTFGFNLNLNYKGFDLSASASGVSGNKIFNGIASATQNGSGYDNYSKVLLDRWTPTNTNTDIPRVVIADPNVNGRISKRWLEDGRFLKITNLELGYTIPKVNLSKIKIDNIRIYLAGKNIHTFTKYTGFDPDYKSDGMFDRAIDNASYANKVFTDYMAGSLPNPRTIMLGVQVGF